MEKHPEIPSKLYGRWKKVINDEFGEIIDEVEENDTENERAQVTTQDEQQPQGTTGQQVPNESEAERPDRSTNPNATSSHRQPEAASAEEQNLLADYLTYGLSLNEAHEAHEAMAHEVLDRFENGQNDLRLSQLGLS